MILIKASQTHSLGFQVFLEFQITQHMRDEQLLRSLIKFLNCGYLSKKRKTFEFRVTKFHDITEKVIPFFQKYSIKGVKAKDFDDWCKVAELMKEKKHLKKKVLDQIRKIKAGR